MEIHISQVEQNNQFYVKIKNKTGPVKGINQMLNLKPKPNDIFLFD